MCLREPRTGVSWIMVVTTSTVPEPSSHLDDITGEPLDLQVVVKARLLLIEYFLRMTVYRKVPNKEAQDAGIMALGIMWGNLEKVERAHRSRHVAKEIETYNAPELFATIPIDRVVDVLVEASGARLGHEHSACGCGGGVPPHRGEMRRLRQTTLQSTI